jgi:hypothetical protein
MVTKKQIKELAREVNNDNAYWDKQDRLSTDWLKDTLNELLDKRIGTEITVDINQIYNMPGLMMSDKFCLIYLLTQRHLGKDEVSAETFINAVGMSRKGFGDVMRRLVPIGMVIRVRQGFYKLNDKSIF